jgi:hypothetical protein
MGKVDISGLIAIQLNRHVRIRVSDSVYAMVRRGVYSRVDDQAYVQAYAQIVRGK